MSLHKVDYIPCIGQENCIFGYDDYYYKRNITCSPTTILVKSIACSDKGGTLDGSGRCLKVFGNSTLTGHQFAELMGWGSNWPLTGDENQVAHICSTKIAAGTYVSRTLSAPFTPQCGIKSGEAIWSGSDWSSGNFLGCWVPYQYTNSVTYEI